MTRFQIIRAGVGCDPVIVMESERLVHGAIQIPSQLPRGASYFLLTRDHLDDPMAGIELLPGVFNPICERTARHALTKGSDVWGEFAEDEKCVGRDFGSKNELWEFILARWHHAAESRIAA